MIVLRKAQDGFSFETPEFNFIGAGGDTSILRQAQSSVKQPQINISVSQKGKSN